MKTAQEKSPRAPIWYWKNNLSFFIWMQSKCIKPHQKITRNVVNSLPPCRVSIQKKVSVSMKSRKWQYPLLRKRQDELPVSSLSCGVYFEGWEQWQLVIQFGARRERATSKSAGCKRRERPSSPVWFGTFWAANFYILMTAVNTAAAVNP